MCNLDREPLIRDIIPMIRCVGAELKYADRFWTSPRVGLPALFRRM